MIKLDKIFIVVPTFKESDLVKDFLESWKIVEDFECVILICNGFPGDKTSDLINNCVSNYPHKIIEISGSPNLYWSGLVELGLRKVAEIAKISDHILLTNIDISFESDPVSLLMTTFKKYPRSQIAGLVRASDGKFLSAGVKVDSWLMSVNTHLFQGKKISDLDEIEITSATYLPTRFVMFPVSALYDAGLPNTKYLPHYCSDYEYTNRIRLSGYESIIQNNVVVENIEKNTGFKTFQQKTNFYQRISKIFDKKCTYNLKYRFWFVWLTYPRGTRLIGLITHFSKIFIEILVGGHRLKR